MTETPYTTKHIIEGLEIPMQRLRMWLLQGYISPSVPSGGHGKKAYFSKSDIYAISLFMKLLGKGLKRELAAEYIKAFQDSADVLQISPYLLFITKSSEPGADPKIEPRSFAGFNPLQLSIWPDKISVTGFEDDSDQCDWDDIVLINFAKLKADVDSRLL